MITKNKQLIETDFAVIGGGLAGCSVALELAEAGKKVDLFLKGKLAEDGNSYLLAGGLTAVPILNGIFTGQEGDSIELHIKDTLSAGKELNDKEIVRFCAENFYPEVIEWIRKRGVNFDKSDKADGKFDLHREGGHSKNRIFHVKDTTGKSIMEILGELVKKNKNITLHENHMAIDLITKKKLGKPGEDACLGFFAYDINKNEVKTVKCNSTFVCTGGLGKVFLYTSNSDSATSDGFAMCYRLGLPLANMEFIQFHPTVFYDITATKEGERRFLLTEALRGAGAFLKLEKEGKEDFVLKYDALGSKATRDVVSRAEDVEMRKLGLANVWLDCTKIPEDKLKNDFKNSYEFCLSKGYDLTNEAVPVVYAEHYSNGGVLVGKNSETSLKGCYVIGETSYTGLHGATRLASNSGPECILFGRAAAKDALKTSKPKNISLPVWDPGRAVMSKDKITVKYYWEVIRRTMNALCGMSRNEQRLNAALKIVQDLKEQIREFYWEYNISKDFLEVRNIADTAEAVLKSALVRKETRACNSREDFAEINEQLKGITLVEKGNYARIEKNMTNENNFDEVQDRYRGVLLGCPRGDALGMPIEGWKREQIKKYAPGGKITNFIDPIIVKDAQGKILEEDEFGKIKSWTKDFKAREWTDDSIRTFNVGESIVFCKGLNLFDIAKRDVEEYKKRKRPDGTVFGGYGGTTMKGFENIISGMSPYESGVIGGPGNAPSMMMHPIGMYMHATGELEFGLEYAKLIAKMTHLDPRSVASGVIQASAVYSLLNDCTRDEFLDSILETCKTHEKPLDERFTWYKSGTLLKRIEWVHSNRDKSAEEAFKELGASSAVYQSYPFALFMFQKYWDKPLEGLIETVNFGGDCDTTGAIYGALAGAKNGTKMFPSSWKEGWKDIERIYNCADGIYNLRNNERKSK